MNTKAQNQPKACKKTIKVLFISHASKLVGAERSLLLLLENIDRKRFEPIVILPTSGPLENKIGGLGIKIYKIKSPWWLGGKDIISIGLTFIYKPLLELLALLRIIKIIMDEKVDLVYTNSVVVFSGAISAYITKTPHVWHIREIILNDPGLQFFLPKKTLINFITKFSNTVVTISQAVADQFSGNLYNEKIVIIPNGVDLRDFKQNKPFPHISGIKSSDWLVAVIGTLEPRKAQDIAIQSIKIAEEQIPNIKLIIIGEGSEKYKEYLIQVVNELNLSDKVVFSGFRTDIPHILPHLKVLLMPSYKEPFGRVTIEAMAAGIPVIGINNGGTKEIIQDNITGYLVSSNKPSEMAEKMNLLYKNPDLITLLGKNGKKLVMEKYSMEKYVKSIEYLIERIIIK